MSGQSATETTPLLEAEVPSPGGAGNGLAKRAVAFRIATTVSLVTGVLTLIFVVVSMALLAGAPPTYNTPYQIYYTFAPVAGFVSAAAPSFPRRNEVYRLRLTPPSLLGSNNVHAFGPSVA